MERSATEIGTSTTELERQPIGAQAVAASGLETAIQWLHSHDPSQMGDDIEEVSNAELAIESD